MAVESNNYAELFREYVSFMGTLLESESFFHMQVYLTHDSISAERALFAVELKVKVTDSNRLIIK